MMETRFIVIQFLHSIGRFQIRFDKFKKLSYFYGITVKCFVFR